MSVLCKGVLSHPLPSVGSFQFPSRGAERKGGGRETQLVGWRQISQHILEGSQSLKTINGAANLVLFKNKKKEIPICSAMFTFLK